MADSTSIMWRSITVHLYIMRFLEKNVCNYQQAMEEMERTFPGWFQQDGDPMIIDLILAHTENNK